HEGSTADVELPSGAQGSAPDTRPDTATPRDASADALSPTADARRDTSDTDAASPSDAAVDTSRCVAPRTGLVAYYPFEGSASDESGHGYDGVPNDVTLT